MKHEYLSKTRGDFLARLSNRKFRTETGLFMAQGVKCVSDLIPEFEVEEILISEETDPGKFDLDRVRIKIASLSQIKKISTLTSLPQVIGIFKIPEEKKPVIYKDEYSVFIDGVQDPGNLGTILRTADWFGYKNIFISKDSADIYNPKTVQATMGSLAHLEIFRCDLLPLIEENPATPVVGTLLEGENLFKTDLPDSGIIIFGSEGTGISEKIREKINFPIHIPSFGRGPHAESLNVGVASGITLALFRNRINKNGEN